jgi:hypothetical protein
MVRSEGDSRVSILALDIINLFTVSREGDSSVSSHVLDIIILFTVIKEGSSVFTLALHIINLLTVRLIQAPQDAFHNR